MAQSITLSSAGSVSMALDPKAKATTVILTQTVAATSGFVTVNFSLDDPTITPPPTITWVQLSSATAMASSTTLTGAGLSWTVLSPIGGIQLVSSAYNGAASALVVKALQSVTA